MAEKIFKRTSDYLGKKKCGIYKKHFINAERKDGLAYDRTIVEKDILKEWLLGNAAKEDVMDLLEGGLINLSDVENTQEALVKKTGQDLMRYINSETARNRKIKVAPVLQFPVGCEWFEEAVDAVAFNKSGAEIEGIIYKAGKPSVSNRTGIKHDDMESLEKWFRLYTGIKYTEEYMRKLCREGKLDKDKKYTISCSFYFMKKNTDRDGSPRDTSFFSDNGGNVVTLSEVHSFNESRAATHLDEVFAPFMENAELGMECQESDCAFCEYNDACNYTKGSKKSEKKDIAAKSNAVHLSNSQQAIISETLNGKKKAIRVNAGAGTGKTTTMTSLYTALLKEKTGFDVSKILILSFTDAGVKELKERCIGACVSEALPVDSGNIEAYTFNAFSFGIIKDNFEILGLKKSPEILTAEYRMQYIEDLENRTPLTGIDDSKIDFVNNQARSLTYLDKAFDIIAGKHLNMSDSDDVNILSIELSNAGFFDMNPQANVGEIADMYGTFREEYIDAGFLTYSDQEPMMQEIFLSHPEVLKDMEYEYIIVDEFQDSNELQMKFIRQLCTLKSFKKLIVVGDDAQSIFAFRETTPEYMLNFEKHIGMPVASLDLLENRRSVGKILALANNVVDLNREKIDKVLIPVKEEGRKPLVRGYHSREKEYEEIIEEMKKLHDTYSWEDMAFIAATKAELVAMSAKLSKAGIPWVMRNPMNLLENSRVKAALAISNAFYEPEEPANYFIYLCAKYDGNIFSLTDDTINEEIEELKETFLKMEVLPFEAQQKLFHEYLEAIRPQGNDSDELYEYFLELLYRNKSIQSELYYTRIFKKYGAKMSKKLSQDYVGVTLTTAHSSKGLEWSVVFNSITKYDIEFLHKNSSKIQAQVEEKRRLLFVSLTRAKELLYVTGQYKVGGNAKEGYIYNQFLNEVYTLLGEEMDPIDHEAEARKKEKTAQKKKTDVLRHTKQLEAVKGSRELTEEERKEYNKLILGATQASLFCQ